MSRSVPPDQRGPGSSSESVACPSAEMLSAYIDGRLDPAQREPIEEHVSRCENCYHVVRETFATLQALDAEVLGPSAASAVLPLAPVVAAASRRRGLGWTLLPAAAIIFVAFGLLTVWVQFRSRDRYAQAIRPLVEAVGNRRFFEARLTGGFQFGPLLPPRRGTETSPAFQDWAVVAAAARVRATAEKGTAPENIRAIASAHQILGENDEAIRLLEELAIRTGDARVLSDLAAAYLAGNEGSDALDVAKALDWATKAAEKDPALPEARFNRSLALERLGLRAQAIESWQEFLRVEPSGGWADEARRHLERLRTRSSLDPATFDARARKAIDTADVTAMRALVHSNVSWSWDLWESTYIGEWAEAIDDGAARRKGLEGFAQTLAERAADSSLLPDDEPTFVHGAQTYLQGRHLYDGEEWTRADQVLDGMPSTLHGVGVWYWAQLYRGILALQQGRPSDAENLLDEVIATAERRGWTVLAGRSYWARAVAVATQGQMDLALQDYASAARHFERVGASEHEAFVAHLEAEILDLIGNQRGAWTARRKALLALGDFRQPRHRFGVYLIGATSALDAGLPSVADALLQEADGDFQANGKASDKVQLILRQAALARVASPAATAALFDRARQTLGLMEDPAARGRFEQELLVTEALSLPSDERGRVALDHAVAMLASRNVEARLPELLFTRAARQASVGRWTQAEGDLDEGFTVYARSAGLAPGQRQAYWRRTEIRMPRLVDAAFATSEPPLAALLEVERARTLWYHEKNLGLGDVQRLVDSVLEGLRPGEIGLSFFDGEEQRGVLVLRRGGYEIVHLPGRPRQVRDLRDLATLATRERNEERLLSCLASLRGLLIDPIQPSLAGAHRLLIVPSADTLGVPFPALWNPARRRFLIEDAEIDSFPSLSAMAFGTRTVQRPPDRILFISGSSEGGDAPLPGVTMERDLLRSAYGDRLSVATPESKAALLRAMGDAGAIHFSGHVKSGRKYPGLSWLKTAVGGEPTVLFAHDLQGARLETGALVVVNGCRSAGDTEAHDGGVGFIRPFMLAGAGAVLASVWDVFDDKAAETMASFHRRYAAGEAAPSALALAQRDLIRRKEPTWGWGGYGIFLQSRPADAKAVPHL